MSDEAFLSRWSRLKRTAAKPQPDAVPAPLAEEAAAPLPDAVPDSAPESDDPLKDLPPIEDLTGESDFTPFLRAGVPEDLHRQALRKLWTSDPVYANDDGLKDYADDYTGLFSGSDPVKTLYRVGKGFLDGEDDAPPVATVSPPDVSPSPPRGEGRGEGDAPRDVATTADALPPPEQDLPLPPREREGAHAEHGKGEG